MYAFSDSEDELLRELTVVAVEPSPNARRLLVTTAPLEGLLDILAALERLENARGWLRCEVAAAITRRKVPELMFQCVLPAASQCHSSP